MATNSLNERLVLCWGQVGLAAVMLNHLHHSNTAVNPAMLWGCFYGQRCKRHVNYNFNSQVVQVPIHTLTLTLSVLL